MGKPRYTTVSPWKDRDPSPEQDGGDSTPFADEVAALIDRLEMRPTPDTVAEAKEFLSIAHSIYRKESVRLFQALDQAQTLTEEEFGPGFRIVDLSVLIDNCVASGVPERRLSLIRKLTEAIEEARARGLWVEYFVLRVMAWVMADPTGLPIAVLLKDIYRPPEATPLPEFDSISSCSAATEMATALRALSAAIHVTQQNPKEATN